MIYRLNISLLIFSFLTPALLSGMQLKSEIDLEGKWRFEIGDDLNFAQPDYNDSEWEIIEVPARWENEGFPGYDGFAWYRKSFKITSISDKNHAYVKLGRIDDTDAVYFNGELIGQSGQFPPNYETAWNEKRIYKIPAQLIRMNETNVLAIRVYDGNEGGGIIDGRVGIYTRLDIIDLAVDLSGSWLFKPGDARERALPSFDVSDWDSIHVPSKWEKQGYPELDHFAWYRTSVNISKNLARDKLILLLGKVNDVDQVFFNGELIGETGEIPQWEEDEKDWEWKDENKGKYKDRRAYFIPSGLIQTSEPNIIAVRVFDIGRNGGIYSEYVGIATREEYLQYQRRLK